MKATIDWTGNASFKATSGSGHSVQLDGPPDHGGQNLGPRPMEMLLMGLGGCSAFDVMSILKKSRQDVTTCHAELEAERADAVPAVFTRIHLHFVVTGKNLKENLVKRAVSLSAEKYCSAPSCWKRRALRSVTPMRCMRRNSRPDKRFDTIHGPDSVGRMQRKSRMLKCHCKYYSTSLAVCIIRTLSAGLRKR